MILQEKIKQKAEGFGKLAPAFLEGVKFALENQWISVEKDLPYNHEELIENEIRTKNVLVVFAWNNDPSKRHIGICVIKLGLLIQIGIGGIYPIFMLSIGCLYLNYQKNRR